MARPLTTEEYDRSLVRPSGVEDQIDAVLGLAPAVLRERLVIVDRGNPDYLLPETLVHLVRHGRRTGDQNLVSLALPVLLSRCEANLLLKVPDGQMPDAASLREEILCSFSELFASDGSGDNPNELNFYECRFNRAFKFFRIDMVRREIARLQPITQRPAPDDDGEPGPYDEVFARVAEAFRTAPTQERVATVGTVEDRPAYKKLMADGVLDRCGMTLLAGKAVGAPFVGAVAGALALSEVLRLLHGVPVHRLIDLDLLGVAHRTVVEAENALANLNPGFTLATRI